LVTIHEIVIDAPNLNALSSELMGSLRRQLKDAGGAPVLISSKGRAFCAGLDIAELSALDEPGMRAFLTFLDEMVEDFYGYPGPLVCAIEGHAIAAGCVIALCCDERIAGAGMRARIGLNEVALGVRFPPRLMAMVRDRVPRRYYERVVMAAELFTMEEGVELGLIDRVADDPLATARERLELLASRPADAYAAAKRPWRVEAMRVSDATRQRWEQEDIQVWWSDPVRKLLGARVGK
jgi:enoyl-CoA hydratase